MKKIKINFLTGSIFYKIYVHTSYCYDGLGQNPIKILSSPKVFWPIRPPTEAIIFGGYLHDSNLNTFQRQDSLLMLLFFFQKKKINLSTVIECPKFTIYDRYRDVVTTFFQKAKRQKRVRYLSLTEMSKEPPTKCHGRCDS